MKQKFYKAEENMKSAFDNYEAPIDDKAFMAFTDALDNSSTTSGHWLGRLFKSQSTYRFGFMAVLFLSAIFVYKFGLNTERVGHKDVSDVDYIENDIFSKQGNPSLTEARNENNLVKKDVKKAGVKESQDNITTDVINNRELQKENHIALSSSSINNIGRTNESTTGLTDMTSAKAQSLVASNVTSREKVASKVLIQNASIAAVDNESRRSKTENVTGNLSESVDPSSNRQEIKTLVADNTAVTENNRREIKALAGVNGIAINALNLERLLPAVGEIIVDPWKEKYKSHFYVGLDGGVAKEINYATVDNYFQKLSFLEIESLGYHLRVKGGYQFSRYAAIELNVHMKDNYLEWDLSNGLYNPYDTRVQNIPIIGLRLLNTFPVGNKLELHTSLGYAMGFNLPYFESTNPGFVIDPGINQTEQLLVTYEYKGTNSSTYNLIEAGIGSSFHITEQMSLTGSFNYFVGSETILSNRIEYIAGEGNPGDFEITSRGGFYSMDVGLVYRFRDVKD